MKKTFILSAVAALLFSAVSVVVYVNSDKNQMDDLFQANVEILANGESQNRYECYDRYKLYVSIGTLTNVRTCDKCDYQQVYRPRTKSVCPR